MQRRYVVIAAVIFLAAGLAFPSSAGQFSGPDSIGEDLHLSPSDDPNGGYAVFDENDKLELLLTEANPNVEGDGIDADAVTSVPRVFTVTYTGERSVEVWLTDDADDVTFFLRDDSTDSLESRENSVTLGPDESLLVGLLVDTRGDHDVESASSFEVNAEYADLTETETKTATATETETESTSGGEGSYSAGGTNGGASTRTKTATPTATPRPTTTADAETTPTETVAHTEPSAGSSTATESARKEEDGASTTGTAATTATATESEPSETATETPIRAPAGFDLDSVALVGGAAGAVVVGIAGGRWLLGRP